MFSYPFVLYIYIYIYICVCVYNIYIYIRRKKVYIDGKMEKDTAFFKLQKNKPDDKDYELIILKVPCDKRKRHMLETKSIHNVKRLCTYYYNNNNNNNNNNKNNIMNNKNNNSIRNYTQKLSNATQKLFILMKQNFNINIKENTNIYCPFHEKESISNSPSAKFYFDTNTYACFSTNCPLKKSFIRNKANSYKGCVCINSVSLLNRIETLISRCTQRSGKLRNTGERLRSWRYST